MKKPLLLLSTLIISSFKSLTIAQTDTIGNLFEDGFFDLSLVDLLNMDVTSVSKKAERLQDLASSIYVLTSADIMNSGATILNEDLKSVPGYWGIQTDYSNVLPDIQNSPSFAGNGTVLFLLDGTPIQDNMPSCISFKNFYIPMDEIDRIEVIRDSGGSVYGLNSATGVVNIFTKNPEKYDEVNVKVDVASPGYVAATLRGGGKVNEKLSVSGYAKVRS
jgi:iron complex outermembrane receptor protein